MEPNLHPNQRLIIEKVSYRFGMPERGDVVVLKLPGRGSDPLIKRVIGLPGETIEIRGGYVYVDGERLQEPYLHVRTRGNTSPREVCDGCVFVLGDNRNASNDSRFFGPVPVDQIVGRAWIRYWPPSDVGVIH
jgi:signal peptidase I